MRKKIILYSLLFFLCLVNLSLTYAQSEKNYADLRITDNKILITNPIDIRRIYIFIVSFDKVFRHQITREILNPNTTTVEIPLDTVIPADVSYFIGIFRIFDTRAPRLINSFNSTYLVVKDPSATTYSISLLKYNPFKPNKPPQAKNLELETNEDTAIEFMLQASDPDNDSLNYIIVRGPLNGRLSGQAPRLTYIPNQDYNGFDSFIYKVNDGKVDSEEAVVNIKINSVNDPPKLDPISDKVIKIGEELRFTISAKDPDNDSLTFSISNLPAGATFNTSTGLFYWIPAQVGNYNILVSVSDGLLSDSKSFNIVVRETTTFTMDVIGQKVEIINGNASGITSYGNYVYMVLNESTKPLVVYDISNPGQPKLVKRMWTPGWPMRVRVIDGTKWLWTVHGNGEGFFDLTDPANPRMAEANEGPNLKFVPRGADNPPYSFKLHPNMTYESVANANTLFYTRKDESQNFWTEIYDISTPQSPKFLARIDKATPRLIKDNLLFVFTTSTEERVQIFDVSQPSNPVKIGTIKVPSEISALGFGLDDQINYDPEKKIVVVGIKKAPPIRWWGLNVTDSRMGGVACGPAIFDVSDWRNIKFLGFGYYPSDLNDAKDLCGADDVTSVANYSYHADPSFGLRVFDISDPQNIRYVYGDREGGELSGYLYLASRKLLLVNQNLSGSFWVIDVSDPENAQVKGYAHHGMATWNKMSVYQDRYAYFTAARRYVSQFLVTVDIEAPSNPQITSVLNVNDVKGSLAYSDTVVTSDGYLYAGEGCILKLTNPAQPTPIKCTKNFWVGPTVLEDPYMYTLTGSSLAIINISDRENPQIIATTSVGTQHRASSITKIGRWVIIAGNTVVPIDVSDIRNPKVIGTWGSAELGILAEQKQVWSDGQRYFFIGNYHSLVKAFDANELPNIPQGLAQLSGLGTAWFIEGDAERNLVFRIGLDGVRIIKYNPPIARRNLIDILSSFLRALIYGILGK